MPPTAGSCPPPTDDASASAFVPSGTAQQPSSNFHDSNFPTSRGFSGAIDPTRSMESSANRPKVMPPTVEPYSSLAGDASGGASAPAEMARRTCEASRGPGFRTNPARPNAMGPSLSGGVCISRLGDEPPMSRHLPPSSSGPANVPASAVRPAPPLSDHRPARAPLASVEGPRISVDLSLIHI